MSKITFSNRNNDFYQSVKASVDEYFEKKKVKRTGDWRLFSKTIILVSAAITMYGVLMLVKMETLPALLICALLGFVFASIGFSVMHDANHGSYSSRPRLNDFLGLSANAMGASSFYWKQKHNIIHHTYTNVDGIDDDIAKAPSSASVNHRNGCPHIKFSIYIYCQSMPCLPSSGCSLWILQSTLRVRSIPPMPGR